MFLETNLVEKFTQELFIDEEVFKYIDLKSITSLDVFGKLSYCFLHWKQFGFSVLSAVIMNSCNCDIML